MKSILKLILTGTATFTIFVMLILASPAMAEDNETVEEPQIFNEEQLAQLLAPIALYPDELIAQVLLASTYPLEIVADQPYFPGEIKIPEDIDGVSGDVADIAHADQTGHGGTGRFVAGAFIALLEAFRLDRQHRDAFCLGSLPAHRLQIVADQPDDAGRIDKGGFRLMQVDQLIEGFGEFFLAAEDDIEFLQVGGKGQPVQLGSG